MSKPERGNRGTTPLRPRARILRTFGDELISSPTVAVIELVKNAYDADATSVLVKFTAPLEVGKGAIDVIDNGHGMSLGTIQETWMEPATLHRKRAPRSEKLGRRVLGEKGIGRFAASRLADELEVITRRAGDGVETHVLFDWAAFDDPDSYLDEIEAQWWQSSIDEFARGGATDALATYEARSRRSRTGTILHMARLRQEWSDVSVDELRTGLARLVSPFKFPAGEELFSIYLDLPEPFEDRSGLVEPPEFLERPQYSLAGNIDAAGRYKLRVELPGRRRPDRLSGQFKIDGRSPACGPIEIEIRAWDRDSRSMRALASEQHSTVGAVREDLDRAAGVNIYRDGFRVLPYGEPRNDWLRLDLRRVQNPTLRLSNNQIVGYVLLSLDENPDLRDQSNREGLIENQAYEDLRQVVLLALQELETRRYAARRPAARSDPGRSIFGNLSLADVRSYVRERYPGDERLLALLGETETGLAQGVEDVQEVIARYRRLATLGQLIDVVLHDGRAPLAKIGNEVQLGRRDIDRDGSDCAQVLASLGRRLTLIDGQIDALATVFRRIEPFGGRRRGRPRRVSLEKIIADTFAVLETDVRNEHVAVTLPSTETTASVDASELQEVIINLLQNSLYWLEQVPEDQRQIVVRVRRHDDGVDIIFSDSGPGVESAFVDSIFDPYFSRKPHGVGLGLTIAGEIVSEYYAGELKLMKTGPLPGATFRISLRRRV
jgi:signal transduction histidine kinase